MISLWAQRLMRPEFLDVDALHPERARAAHAAVFIEVTCETRAVVSPPWTGAVLLTPVGWLRSVIIGSRYPGSNTEIVMRPHDPTPMGAACRTRRSSYDAGLRLGFPYFTKSSAKSAASSISALVGLAGLFRLLG